MKKKGIKKERINVWAGVTGIHSSFSLISCSLIGVNADGNTSLINVNLFTWKWVTSSWRPDNEWWLCSRRHACLLHVTYVTTTELRDGVTCLAVRILHFRVPKHKAAQTLQNLYAKKNWSGPQVCHEAQRGRVGTGPRILSAGTIKLSC
jgi:hypothetical protein